MSSYSVHTSIDGRPRLKPRWRSSAASSLLDAGLQELDPDKQGQPTGSKSMNILDVLRSDTSQALTRQLASSLQFSSWPVSCPSSASKRSRQVRSLGALQCNAISKPHPQDAPHVTKMGAAAQQHDLSQKAGLIGYSPTSTSSIDSTQSGLLNLPDHVLVKIICLLSHADLKPLSLVCTEFRSLVKDAVEYHFAYNTPAAHLGGTRPITPKPSRIIAVEDKPATSDWLYLGQSPPMRNQPRPGKRIAPRALRFSSKKPKIWPTEQDGRGTTAQISQE